MKKHYKKSIIIVLAVALLVGNLSNVCLIKAKGNRTMKVRTLENILERSMEEKNGYILISSKRGRISQNDNLNKISLNKSHIIKEIGVVDNNKSKIINKYRDKPDIYMEQNYIAKGNRISSYKTISKEESKVEWNFQMIGWNNDIVTKKEKRKVKVAVLDSGIDVTQDINVVKRINLIPGEENMLPVYEDVIGHGTSVAGIIGSNGKKSGIIGVNPNVEIYSAKVLDDHNSAPISRIIEGIYWAIENKVDIINFSLGTIHNSRALHQAISEAYKKGIVLIASSGNDNSIEYPAAYEEVISVGSVGTDEKIVGEHNENKVDIYAPGDLVRSVGAFDGTLVSSGTSMAAPHITGIVSIILEKGEKVTPHFLKVLLKESGRQLDNCGEAKIADLEYALSIYDKLKASYDFSENRFIYFADIEQNNRDIEVDEPEGYVQGRWSGANHEAAVESAAMYGIYDQAVLYLVKYGARIPDRWFPGNSTSENNGAFHGWGNYIANTIAMYRMALEGRKKANLNDISTYEGHNEICKKIRDRINAKIDAEFPTYSETEKELIVLGMALHCETDAFAHKSYYFNGTSWVRYNATDADNINIAPKRFESAKRVAMSWVSHWRNGDTYTTYSPFAIQDYYYDGSFKMEKMIEYSIRCNRGNPLTDTFLGRMQKVSITP